ncbi:unnamed protein product [Schistosoma mattheei]|uniref:Uncharacterized protein n=1 Tax=Schistosoma mattheei TaxID=31246 RepID=A0A183PN01_9TREM|nr:unnamed protein product [Schistosoma mattheei]
MLLYSGHKEENVSHTQRFALMLSNEASKALNKASFKTKEEITMNIIQCYVSTNGSKEHHKDQFYKRLESIIEKCSGKELLILIGGLNVDVGMYNTGYEDILGRQRLGD